MFPSNPNIGSSHTEQGKVFVYNGEGWVLQSDLILPDGSRWEDGNAGQIIPKNSKHIPSAIIDGLPLFGDIVTRDADEFATAAQGALASTALQSVTSTDDHIVVDNADTKNPTISFLLGNEENFFSDDEQTKLIGIEAGAEVNDPKTVVRGGFQDSIGSITVDAISLTQSVGETNPTGAWVIGNTGSDDVLWFGNDDYKTRLRGTRVNADNDVYAKGVKLADVNHNHNLADLTERSYNSLTDLPNLSLLEDVLEIDRWAEIFTGGDFVGQINYEPTLKLLYSWDGADWQQLDFQWKMYVNKDTISDLYGKVYIYNGIELFLIPDALVLGETPSTAFDGLRGKAAYDHSLTAHAPVDAEKNTIEGLKNNGVDLAVVNEKIDIHAYGSRQVNSQVEWDYILTNIISGIYKFDLTLTISAIPAIELTRLMYVVEVIFNDSTQYKIHAFDASGDNVYRVCGVNNFATDFTTVTATADLVTEFEVKGHTHDYEPANSNIQQHISTTGNPHGTEIIDLTDVDLTETTPLDTDSILIQQAATGKVKKSKATTVAASNAFTRKFVDQNGGTIYHITRWFTPTAVLQIAANGLSATITSGQFTAAMTGAKLRLTGGINEPIITYVSTNSITLSFAVDSSFFGQSVAVADWGVYSIDRVQAFGGDAAGVRLYTSKGELIQNVSYYGRPTFASLITQSLSEISSGMQMYTGFHFRWGGGQYYGPFDTGLFRPSAGLLQIYDGITTSALRDLKLRSLYADKIIPNSDTTGVVIRNAADSADFALFNLTDNRLELTVASTTPPDNAGLMLKTVTGERFNFGLRDNFYAWIQAVKPNVGYRNLLLSPLGGLTGIRTTTPETTLDVNGDITARGWNYFNTTTAAARPTGDVVGDRRTKVILGVETTEICTVANTTRGSGTWVVLRKSLADKSHQIGDDTNNVTINANGTIKLNGTATVFDDLKASALSLLQTGAGISQNIPEACVEYTTGANTADYMVQSLQMPHTWKIGSVIYPHLHFRQTAAQVPNFLIQYRWQINGQAETTAWTDFKCNTTAFTYTSGTINQIAHGGGLTPPVGAMLSDIVEFRIIRDTTNASTLFAGADPLAATVRVRSFDVHIENDQLGGSNEEYIK